MDIYFNKTYGKIKKRRDEKECICGSILAKENMNEHLKTRKHHEKMKIIGSNKKLNNNNSFDNLFKLKLEIIIN
jgi:hypothetical protein